MKTKKRWCEHEDGEGLSRCVTFSSNHEVSRPRKYRFGLGDELSPPTQGRQLIRHEVWSIFKSMVLMKALFLLYSGVAPWSGSAMERRVVDDHSNGRDSEHCHGKCFADRRWSCGHRSPASCHPTGMVVVMIPVVVVE